jgi:hypothetical protein
MRIVRVLPLLFAFALPALAQGAAKEEITPYTVEEIENYLAVFKSQYSKKKIPQEDAIAALQNLRKGYLFLDSKGDQATKDDAKLKEKIIKHIALGLKAKDRDMVSWECAKALGALADPDGQKPLLTWMEDVVLDAKNPPIQSVEAGFLALAMIGSEDKATMDMLESYATGKHQDYAVASHALKAVSEWKHLDGKMRKEFFEKISQSLLGLYSNWKGGDVKTKGVYEQRYNTVKENGLITLRELAGDGTNFLDPQTATDWYRENKKRKWDDYAAPRLRKKEAPKPAEGDEKKGDEKKGDGDA